MRLVADRLQSVPPAEHFDFGGRNCRTRTVADISSFVPLGRESAIP